MKFLCPSCKAKYQIADEKVAGRSVRMKCRKCGFMIQVSSAMAAPSGLDSDPPEALSSLPPAPAPAVAAPSAATAQPGSSPVASLSAKGAPAKSAPKAAPSPAAPAVGTLGAAAAKAGAPKAAIPAPRPPPGKPSGALPRPAAPPPRASAPKPAGTSLVGGKAAAATASAVAAAPAPAAAPAAKVVAPAAAPEIKELPRDFEGDDEVTRMADAGALAGAFTQAFGGGGAPAAQPAEADAPISMPGDEWFVGINGVPVGPIRLSELRSKAASGAVTKESLVWRDGFEDWRPLKTYPELLAIVEEGVSSARASLTPFMPSASEGKNLTATPGVVAADALAAQPSSSAVTGSAVVTDDLSAFVPPRRGTSPMVWVAMVIAIALGLTLGFVLFGGQKPAETKIVEKIVEKEVPAKDTQAPVAANDRPGETIAADPQAPKKPGTGSGKQTPNQPTGEGEGKPLTGLKGLNGLNGLGPSTGPATGGPSGSTNGGAQLDGSQIQATVSRYTGSVKRRCWQPALDARARDAPMTAKVTVTITVGGTGSVQNATTTGDPKGYTGLANCIASSVRSWQFPASGGTTIANVPFVFAGQ
jgi:predicted Zn finger-like uncharacterized protein